MSLKGQSIRSLEIRSLEIRSLEIRSLEIRSLEIRSLEEDELTVAREVRAHIISDLPKLVLGLVVVGFVVSGFNSDIRNLTGLALGAVCLWFIGSSLTV